VWSSGLFSGEVAHANKTLEVAVASNLPSNIKLNIYVLHIFIYIYFLYLLDYASQSKHDRQQARHP
jgi:hypothetical protein